MKIFFYLFISCFCTQVFSADIQSISIKSPEHSHILTETNSKNSTSNTKPLVFISTTNPGCQQIHQEKFKAALIQSINEIRKQPRQCGTQHYEATNKLTWNKSLEKSSYKHAKDLAKRQLLSHSSISGQVLKARLTQVGYQGITGGENLASGQKTVHQVLNDWMTLSPSHCSNIMTNNYSDYALACVTNTSTGRSYWVQQFGRENQE